ncbi:NUDIX domain-containing protein [Pseudomonas sp. SWRI111]|uniref:NUDIX domain-containing protein n=1 Tax=Pseudomonas hamedanensis TaxID=2745504 RepID=A0A9E6NZ12_9PSED|nr:MULTISPECIES: NUDIX domain-containing protein [Pseudomonas]MBC3208113.1 NUDIX domain-containing protein [Pseudomonas sp. SWRI111]QXI16818.1 NUDIX domain-containing protein [Pseudomonas hamedanensis]
MTLASVASAQTIHIAAALLLNAQGQTLLVRKRGTTAFMQPGGKIEPRELPVHALARELEEELGLCIDPAQAAFLGEFAAPAANEPGYVVCAQIFQLTIDAEVCPAAEIEEVIWVDPATDPAVDLAPLTRDLILPFYRRSLTALA